MPRGNSVRLILEKLATKFFFHKNRFVWHCDEFERKKHSGWSGICVVMKSRTRETLNPGRLGKYVCFCSGF